MVSFTASGDLCFGKQVKLIAQESHSRVVVPLDEKIQFQFEEDKKVGISMIRFPYSLKSSLELPTDSDKFQRIDKILWNQSGDQLHFKFSKSFSSEEYKTYAYFEAEPPRIVIDFWSDKKPKKTKKVAKIKPVKKRVIAKPKRAVVRKLAAVKKASAPKLKTIFWDYPFISRLSWMDDWLKSRTFPDEGIKFRKAISRSKSDSHYQLIINLFTEGDYALCLKTIDMFYQNYSQHLYTRDIRFIEAASIIRLEGLAPNSGYREKGVGKLRALIDFERDDEINERSFHFLVQEDLKNNQIRSATDLLNKMIEKKTRDSKIYHYANFTLGQIYHDSEMYDSAEVRFSDALKSASNASEKKQVGFYQEVSNYMKYLKNGNYVIPQKLVSKIRKKYPKLYTKSKLLRFNQGESLFRSGQYADSLKIFDAFLKDFPDTVWASWAILRLGEIYEITDEKVIDAVEIYKNLLNRFPGTDAARIGFSRMVMNQVVRLDRRIDEPKFRFFLDELTHVSENYKDSRMGKLALVAKGRLFLATGRFREGYEFLKIVSPGRFQGEFRKIFLSDISSAIEARIIELLRDGKYSEAVAIYENNKRDFLKSFTDKNLKFYLAYALSLLGRHEDSLSLFSKKIDFKKICGLESVSRESR